MPTWKTIGNAQFPLLCVAHKIPNPLVEHRFHPTREWRFDYAWPAELVALEVEGGIFSKDGKQSAHRSISGILRDIEKYSEAACLGWRILRVIPDDLQNQKTMDRIRRALLWQR